MASSLQLWQVAIQQYRAEHPEAKKGKLPAKGSAEYDAVKQIHCRLVAEAKGTEYVEPQPTFKQQQPQQQQQHLQEEDHLPWAKEILSVIERHSPKQGELKQQQQQKEEPVVTSAKRPRGRPRKVQPVTAELVATPVA